MPRSPLFPCGDVATEEGCPQQGTELLSGPWLLPRPLLSVLRYLKGMGSLLGLRPGQQLLAGGRAPPGNMGTQGGALWPWLLAFTSQGTS